MTELVVVETPEMGYRHRLYRKPSTGRQTCSSSQQCELFVHIFQNGEQHLKCFPQVRVSWRDWIRSLLENDIQIIELSQSDHIMQGV